MSELAQNKGENSSAPLVMLAAGGTGGHMFPAIALAEEMRHRGCRVMLVTDTRGRNYNEHFADNEIAHVSAATLGKGIASKVTAGFRILYGIGQARRLIKTLNPAAIVGFGGYPSLPTMLAARSLNLPAAIHEQNSVLGRANRILAPHAKVIATSFPRVEMLPETAIKRVVLTGNPVRREIIALGEKNYRPPLGSNEAASTKNADATPIRLLVVGGSQGAAAFNTLVPEALSKLPEEMRGRIQLTQQVRGPQDESDKTAAALDSIGVRHELAPFFTDMPQRLAGTHLVIGRAGASTVAENTAAGIPAIMIPYPHAIDDHQARNAEAVEKTGGGWYFIEKDLTADKLAKRLRKVLSSPEKMAEAARAAHSWGRPRAAQNLADAVDGIIASARAEYMARNRQLENAAKSNFARKNKGGKA